MASLSLQHINKTYPNGFEAVKDFNLEIEDKEFIIFVGPSGCGKSTTLRMVAGLEEITSGTLKIGDKVMNDVEPKDRDIAMVFQNYALYPHMTVYDNMAFGLKLRKVPKDQIDKAVREAARILDLEKLLDRKPKALSVFPDFGSMTNSQELDVLCYILVVSVGLSILFNRNASSGGLDIVAKIMNKYLHMELGKAISLSGMCIALSAALVYDKKSVVLSVLGTYFNGLLLDHFIFGQNIKRRVCIITKHEKELRDFILHNLHSGATIYEAVGAYNMEKRNDIITIVDKGEYQKLMDYMNHKDPEAFITVYTVSDLRYRPKV